MINKAFLLLVYWLQRHKYPWLKLKNCRDTQGYTFK